MVQEAEVIGKSSTLATRMESPEQMIVALTRYRDLQRALDASMPDQIMNLDGKPFRKKGYWRAIALAFHLDVVVVKEERVTAGQFLDNKDNFGWIVTYEARQPDGRCQPGDGACFAVEKARRFKCPHPEAEGSRRTKHFPHNTCPDFDPDFQWKTLPGDATDHNVRGHAHTRAYNRSVSNLVGFGEVSAEEVVGDEHGTRSDETKSAGQGTTAGAQSQTGPTPAADGVTIVKDVTSKSGTKNNKPWTLYTVVFADGRQGKTFDSTLAKRCEAAKATGVKIVPEIETNEKGSNLKNLQDPPVTVAPPVAHPADEPVTGPEKILAVRDVVTPNGPRWVIQTEKRQLATDKEDLAKAAKAAREGSAALLPHFDVMPTTHGPINRLLGWVSAPWAQPATSPTTGDLPGIGEL